MGKAVRSSGLPSKACISNIHMTLFLLFPFLLAPVIVAFMILWHDRKIQRSLRDTRDASEDLTRGG